MPASKQRVAEVVDYALIHGDDKALESFNVDKETLTRYKRSYKQHFGENADLLMQIKNRYSPDELRMIAVGSTQSEKKSSTITFDGDEIVFGAMGDTHIGSRYTDESYIKSALEEFDKQKCQFFTHGGDVTEGMSGRDGHVYELSHIGYQAQKEASIALFKDWKKPSYFISGNHDAWYISKANMGADIVADICSSLSNAIYLGLHEGDIHINGAKIRLWHGEDTGSYAISYRLQKLVESFTGGEKPNVLICSHTHKAGYFFERNVQVVTAGSLQKQSAWMRRKRLAAHTGFYVIKMGIKNGSVIWFEPRWYPFY